MNVLIAFAGKHGCTEKCAELVGKKLHTDADIINLKKIKNVDISKYQKVIIGSSLYYGKIQKEAAEFCREHLDSLSQKNIGLFVCGMQKDAGETALTQNFPAELLKAARSSEFFGGEFILDNMNFMEKMIVKKIAGTKSNITDLHEENIERFIQSMNSI